MVVDQEEQTHMDILVPSAEDDGPGPGSKRKSPTGMSVQKHSVTPKLKEQARS